MGNVRRIVYCVDGELINGSIPILEQAEYWHKAGWSTRFVSRTRSPEFAGMDWHELTDANLADVEWWRNQNANHAIFYSLSSRPEYMSAARSAGLVVTIDADNECILSPRLSLRRWHNRYFDARHGLLMRVKMLKLLLVDRLTAKKIEGRFLSRLDACHFLKTESPLAADNVNKLLSLVGRQDLATKIIRIPFPVRADFISIPVDGSREFCCAIMGRLNDQQKDPSVLLALLRKLLRTRNTARFVIMTRDVTEPFKQLSESFHGRIQFIQGASRQVVADFLSRSSVFLSASRIESLPVAALEAACVGCVVVGTPLSGFQYLCNTLGYGQHSARHTSNSLLHAFQTVEQLLSPEWSDRISRDARSRFSLEAVTQKWIDHFLSRRK